MSRIIKLIIIVVLVFCLNIKNNAVYAQFNLVLNPGFELLDTCPFIPNTPSMCTYWDTLKSGGGGGADAWSICNDISWYPAPDQAESYQIPKSGGTYITLGVFYRDNNDPIDTISYPFRRDYIQTKLKQKLIASKSYCVKYYVSNWTKSMYGIDELGAYLDDGSVYANYYKPVYGVNPQIKSPVGVFYADTVNWLPVYGNFVAAGTEEYLTLGNFKSEAATNYIIWNTLPNQRIIASYYIEDVSIIESDLPAYAGHDTTILQGDSTFIGRTPEIGLECVWYANGMQLQTQEAGFWASPDTTTTYIVKQDLCDNIKYDTVIVSVIPNGSEELQGNRVFELYPNPNKGRFVLHWLAHNGQTAEIAVSNILGELIYKSLLVQGTTEFDLDLHVKGVYFITLKNTEFTRTKKMIIE